MHLHDYPTAFYRAGSANLEGRSVDSNTQSGTDSGDTEESGTPTKQQARFLGATVKHGEWRASATR